MKSFANICSHLTRWLVIFMLLGGGYSALLGADNFQDSPCLDGSISLENQANTSVVLSVQKATCEDYASKIELQLTNLSTKTIIKYEIVHTQDFENRKGLAVSRDVSGALIKSGDFIRFSQNEGYSMDDINRGKTIPFGKLKRDIIKLMWVKFADGTLAGTDDGFSDEKEPRGYDLSLTDDKEPVRADFEFVNNTFAINSEKEYAFGGATFKTETVGCKKDMTFDFLWRGNNYSYHPRNKPDDTITIKTGDNLHGEFTYDSCTKTAKGTIRDDNQNLELMNLAGSNISQRNP